MFLVKTVKLAISIDEEYQEALVSELEEMGFEGYQLFDDELIAYIQQKNFQIGDRERIEQLLGVYPGSNFVQTEQIVEERNWNREWEKTIQPKIIDCFLVKPTWSKKQADKDKIVLEVDPKMAFGTGCHATTGLMLKMLSDLISPGQKVLDAGTGTGILAIAAAKLGAERVIAFDNDNWSVQNARENILLNEVEKKVEIRQGSIETVIQEENFDAILVNINKNTIIEMLEAFKKLLSEEGFMLLSGLLKKDEPDINGKLKKNGLKLIKIEQEQEWIAIHASKNK